MASRSSRLPSGFLDVRLGGKPQPHGATFTYRAWLLLSLHIHPVGWRGIQPPYCFHGATASRWPRSASLGLIIGWRAELPRPTTLYLHTGIWPCDPYTRALLLPSIPNLLAPGCREAISVFVYPPFLLGGLPHQVFSEGVDYYPHQGSEPTTRPCLRAPMGETSHRRSAAELAWLVPVLTGHATELPRSTHPLGPGRLKM